MAAPPAAASDPGGVRLPVVVMGVCGAGKSTVSALLAAKLGGVYLDADDLHSPANKAKMAAGVPLTDADREITKELIDRGLAPYIISTQDRILFAKEMEEKEREREDEDVGVGRTADDSELGGPPTLEDRGQYGDFSGSNAASGNVAEIAEAQRNDFEEDEGQV